MDRFGPPILSLARKGNHGSWILVHVPNLAPHYYNDDSVWGRWGDLFFLLFILVLGFPPKVAIGTGLVTEVFGFAICLF